MGISWGLGTSLSEEVFFTPPKLTNSQQQSPHSWKETKLSKPYIFGKCPAVCFQECTFKISLNWRGLYSILTYILCYTSIVPCLLRPISFLVHEGWWVEFLQFWLQWQNGKLTRCNSEGGCARDNSGIMWSEGIDRRIAFWLFLDTKWIILGDREKYLERWHSILPSGSYKMLF